MMAILDLGWETAMLWLVYGGSIIYGRPLADGGVGRLHETLVTRHGLEPDVADYLLTEVGLSDKHHADAAAAADADEDREHMAAARPRPDRSDRPPLPDHDARAILVTYADEMVRELTVSFAYAAHEYQDGEVGRLLMVGGGSAMPGLAGRLTDALGVAAAPVAPEDLAGCDPDLRLACGSPALTAAAGLALFPEAR
jgi:Tfp pilus assembly PilM family ATPase